MSKLQELINELNEMVKGTGGDLQKAEAELSEDLSKQTNESECAVEEPEVFGEPEADDPMADEAAEIPQEKQCDVDECHKKREYAVRKGHKVCFFLCHDHVREYVKTDGLKRKAKYI